jgi:hypothetical protein
MKKKKKLIKINHLRLQNEELKELLDKLKMKKIKLMKMQNLKKNKKKLSFKEN